LPSIAREPAEDQGVDAFGRPSDLYSAGSLEKNIS